MQKVSITRADLKNNLFNLILTLCYTLIIAIIYSYWAYVTWYKLWVSVLIVVTILMAGYLVGLFWTYSLAKKRAATKENNQEETK